MQGTESGTRDQFQLKTWLWAYCLTLIKDRNRNDVIAPVTSAACLLSPTAPPSVRIVHSGQACNVEEERYSERVFTIREGGTLELQCLVTGHPRPQVPVLWEFWELCCILFLLYLWFDRFMLTTKRLETYLTH